MTLFFWFGSFKRLKWNRWFFGRFEDTKNCFWNYWSVLKIHKDFFKFFITKLNQRISPCKISKWTQLCSLSRNNFAKNRTIALANNKIEHHRLGFNSVAILWYIAPPIHCFTFWYQLLLSLVLSYQTAI